LRFHFPTISDAVHERNGTTLFPYPADSEEGTEKLSPYTRKPPFHFGWDIAPRCITRGLKGKAEILTQADFHVGQPVVYIQSLDDTLATVLIQTPISFVTSGKCAAKLIPLSEGIEAQSLILDPQKNNPIYSNAGVEFHLTIKNPKRWWPKELGEPFLYQCEILIESSTGVEKRPVSFGLRTIILDQGEPSQNGHTGETELMYRSYDTEGNIISTEFVQTDFPFTFVVNGKPFFAKGANWVPSSIDHPALLGQAKMQEYLFQQMADAGFNMVRVWGGGEYPDERFFQLADSLGILVWQDFMFSGTMYPGYTELPKILDEAVSQVHRISAHPSLALWCGNNEIEVAWKNWGWQQKYHYSRNDSLDRLCCTNIRIT
jgi:beta-mannosidase